LEGETLVSPICGGEASLFPIVEASFHKTKRKQATALQKREIRTFFCVK